MGENNSASAGSTNSNGSVQHCQPQPTADYLAQLLKDKKQLTAFPSNTFVHLERLLDEEVGRVRDALFQLDSMKRTLELPEPEGSINTIQEKVFVPVKEHPDYNFVGRLLGPRGMTAKQLEQETGCKIMIRGRGSMRDKKKEELNRGKPNWEHLAEDLHVLISCEDTENRAVVKLARAVEEIKKLLVPAPEGEDELKRKQLMELAIINGTYRPANQAKLCPTMPLFGDQQRLLSSLSSPLRTSTLGAPIILSPTRLANTPPVSLTSAMNGCPSLVPTTPTDLSAAAGLFYRFQLDALDPLSAAAYPLSSLSSQFAFSDYAGLEQAGAILNTGRILGQVRDFPYKRPSLQPPGI